MIGCCWLYMLNEEAIAMKIGWTPTTNAPSFFIILNVARYSWNFIQVKHQKRIHMDKMGSRQNSTINILSTMPFLMLYNTFVSVYANTQTQHTMILEVTRFFVAFCEHLIYMLETFTHNISIPYRFFFVLFHFIIHNVQWNLSKSIKIALHPIV